MPKRAFKLVVLFPLFISATASAESLDKIQFIKIDARDARAVVKGGDGKLVVIKPGDSVTENVIVKEIAPGRIVLEERTGKDLETIVVRMTKDHTMMERMRRHPDRIPVLLAPSTTGN